MRYTALPRRSFPIMLATLAGIAGSAHAGPGDCSEPSVAWRVPLPGPFAANRPAIGPSGEVAMQTTQIVVVNPDGTERFRNTVPLSLGDSYCDIDNAGRVYANSTAGIKAFSPSGDELWTLAPSGGFHRGHAGPTVGPDGNIYFIDIALSGYGFASVSPEGQLRWNEPGFGDADTSRPRTEIAFTNGTAIGGAPQIPDDCNGSCLASGLMAFDFDGSHEWTAHTTMPLQPVVRSGGDLYLPVEPSSVRDVNGSSGSSSPISLGTKSNTGNVVAVAPDGTGYAVTNYNTLTRISPNGSSSDLVTLSAIMGSPAVSPDGSLIVVGTADSLIASQNYITGIDAQTGLTRWSIKLPTENGYRLSAIGWPRFSGDGSHVYVGVNAGNDSYLYAVEICGNGSGEPCIADVNGDGSLTPTDFTAWINAYNNDLPECDQNADGACTPTDFSAWITNFNAGC